MINITISIHEIPKNIDKTSNITLIKSTILGSFQVVRLYWVYVSRSGCTDCHKQSIWSFNYITPSIYNIGIIDKKL